MFKKALNSLFSILLVLAPYQLLHSQKQRGVDHYCYCNLLSRECLYCSGQRFWYGSCFRYGRKLQAGATTTLKRPWALAALNETDYSHKTLDQAVKL